MDKKKSMELFLQLQLIERLKEKSLVSNEEYEALKKALLSHYPPETTFFFS